MFRLFLLCIDLLLVGIISIIAYPFSILLGVFSKNSRENFTLGFVRVSMKSMLFLAGTKVEYIGLENIPEAETVVFIGNHRSFFDVIATYAVMKRPTGFVAKKEMRHWPAISWWMSAAHCLFLDRTDARQGIRTILNGIKNINAGISMVVYPEGTRSKAEGTLGVFHNASFALAAKPRAKIIPVVYNNSGAIWEDHMPWIKSAPMRVEFCRPIETKDLSKDQLEKLPELVRGIIIGTHIKNGKALGSLPEDYEYEQ